MSDDFTLVREAFAESIPGRILAAGGRLTQSAWRTSVVRRTSRSMADRIAAMPAASLTGTAAAAIAFAAAIQPILMWLMPSTVVPAMPWPAFVITAMFAALIAWQRDAVVSAWRSSRWSRWIRR
jgi:hypothetical protein